MARTDILYYGGGDALTQYGALSRRLGQPKDEVVEVHTRASTARLVDRNGVMRSAASSGVPRIEWINTATDGTRDTPALLLEGSRTNGIIHSEDFTATTWTKTNTTATANAGAAPDGATTADGIIETATDAAHTIGIVVGTVTNDTDQASSFYVKASNRDWVYIKTTNKANASKTTWFSLASAAAGTTASGHTARIEAYGSDWYRVGVKWDAATGGTSPAATLGLATADGQTTHLGVATTNAVLAWGAQNDKDGGFWSSYIPTTTGAVTRATDVYYETFPWKPQEMTLYVKMEERGTGGVTAGGVVFVGTNNATTDPRLSLHGDGDGTYTFLHDNGTVNASVSATAAVSLDDTVELRGVLNSDGSVIIGQSINSGTEATASSATTGTLATAWAGARLYVGSRGGANVGFVADEKVIIARGVKTMAEMRAL